MWPTNMRKNAKWKSNLISAEAWRALYGDKLHLLFVIFHFFIKCKHRPRRAARFPYWIYNVLFGICLMVVGISAHAEQPCQKHGNAMGFDSGVLF